ncbi:polysaccharide biosynthesis/export family protein [Aquimarina sp. 2201CG5-10]|uniref:polysaccharide biosynthesis/export family protein n=1 Tax=Aquimarina callyspongiae TaxID=3098150 RepID=UPI002AB40341|nr:polysaccharide biosynthesis/export family protein [Aquimarina sp. 2201CG5-10]MDY8136272.1 polysaccharide biosynthesis/export family protein [Aquimarina sp. 2201CG5-10]
MQSYKPLLFLIISVLVFSCKAPADVVYFQNSKDLEQIPSKNSFTPVFKVDDVISILVSASDMDAARPFNLMQGSSITAGISGENAASSGAGTAEPTYLIDEQGNIDFPVLGKLKLAGLTRVQVKEMIKEKLKIYIKDPIVSIRLKNFKITVMGEVNTPGSFTIPNERITIIEALGLAGDMTIRGKRQNVMIIRENDGVNTYHRIDLTSKTIFDSPAYYLAQNDVLYVEPNESQVRSSRTNNNVFGIILSIVGVTLSALALILR